MRRARSILLFTALVMAAAGCLPVVVSAPAPTQTPTPTSTPTSTPTPSPTPTPAGPRLPTPAALPATNEQTLVWGGLVRRFLVHYPPDFNSQNLRPLVIFLHGRGGTAASAAAYFGLNPKSDTTGFLVAYPEAVGNPPAWNAGFNTRSETSDDLGFLKALVALLRDALPVDPQRIYVSGFSSGAMMAYRLAIEIPEQLAAVGAVSGAIGSFDRTDKVILPPDPKAPISAVIIHGRQDNIVLYNGGRRQDPGSSPIVGYLGVEDAVKFWVRTDGCPADPVITTPAAGVTLNEYRGCRQDTEVAFYSVQTGGHEWIYSGPGGFSTTDAIWNFFASHRLKR